MNGLPNANDVLIFRPIHSLEFKPMGDQIGQFEDYHLFCLIVEHESIGKAADTLHIAKSAASRRLKLLEERYDTLFIERKAGQWRVTPSGQAFYERALPLVEEFRDINEEFTYRGQALRGKLRISSAEIFGLNFLLPHLLDFREAYPDIDLELDFDDRMIDLGIESYDLAVRISASANDADNVLTMGTTRHIMVAADEYLRNSPPIHKPEDLKAHRILHFGKASRCVWNFTTPQGEESISLRPYLKSNSGQALFAAAKRGMGVVRAPDFLLQNAIRTHELIPVLPQYKSNSFQIRLIKPPSKRINAKMRTMIEFMKQKCMFD